MAIDMSKKKNRSAELMLALRKTHQFDPLTELMSIYRTSNEVDDKERIKICQDLMGYMYPKMKAIELDTKANNPVVFNFDIKGDVQDVKSMAEAA